MIVRSTFDRGSNNLRMQSIWKSSPVSLQATTRYAQSVLVRHLLAQVGRFSCTLCLLTTTGCEGELAALLYLGFGFGLAALLIGRDRQARSLHAAENLKQAIASGQHRQIEFALRKQLQLVAAGEAVSREREWLTRAQLGGLLVAEWRLDEAREIYGSEDNSLSPHLKTLANFGRLELSVLTETPTDTHLNQIREDRNACIALAPKRYQHIMRKAWQALEGLCLARMGKTQQAIPLLESGLESLVYSPARVIYLYHLAQAFEQSGKLQLASSNYRYAAEAFPGTRLANEAQTRQLALSDGHSHTDSMFRTMLPEVPAHPAFVPSSPAEDDEQDSTSGQKSDEFLPKKKLILNKKSEK